MIPLFAAVLGWLFNAAMPQGIGVMPRYVAHPLWLAADVDQTRQLWQEGALLVDARDPGEYKRGHVRGAINLYPEEWELMLPLLEPQLQQASRLLVYGRSTSRFPAAWVGQKLRQMGMGRVWVSEEGMERLEMMGLPMRRPAKRGGGS